MRLKRISLQEAFSLGGQTSFHLFIKDKSLMDGLLRFLEEKRVCWNNDKRPTKLKEFMDNRVYPVTLTVNNTFTGYRMTYADCVDTPSDIKRSWGKYPTEGYVLVDRELLTLKIKRRNKL